LLNSRRIEAVRVFGHYAVERGETNITIRNIETLAESLGVKMAGCSEVWILEAVRSADVGLYCCWRSRETAEIWTRLTAVTAVCVNWFGAVSG